MTTSRVTGANFYHTHLFSIFKDPKEQKCPNTPAADLKHYILCISDTWWQQDMQLNALPCYEEPTERIWLTYPTDFHITYNRASESKTNRNSFCLTPSLIWLLLYCDFKCIILAIFYFSNQWKIGALLSTLFHGWRILIILNNTWQPKITSK